MLLVGTVLCVTANAQDLIGCAASLHTLCPAPPIPLDGEPSPAPFGHLQLHVPGDHRGGREGGREGKMGRNGIG